MACRDVVRSDGKLGGTKGDAVGPAVVNRMLSAPDRRCRGVVEHSPFVLIWTDDAEGGMDIL